METNLIDVNPADDGPDGTWDGTQDETFTDDPGEDGTALDQAGSTLGLGATNVGDGGNGKGSRSGAGGNGGGGGAAKAGDGVAPRVTIGNEPNGGARGTGGGR